MKKILTIFLILILLTGCTTKEEIKETTKKKDNEVVENTENIDTSEKNIITTADQQATDTVNETELVTYIEEVEQKIETITTKDTLTETDQITLKNTFITLTDFIFYGGTIKGKTFTELTTEAKEKVLTIYETIDTKIETKYPGYKETIKDNGTKIYSTVKEKTVELKDTLVSNYKDYVGEEAYNTTIDRYEEGKSNLKEVYEIYEPTIETVKEKTKEKYNETKDKVSSWYQEWKESGN